MATTNTWLNAELSTTESIERWESDINGLLPPTEDWNPKVAASKELLGDKLEEYLKAKGYVVDYEEGEVLLDIIYNPTCFSVSSDYLTLAIIYEDLSRGDYETLYGQKAKIYYSKFDNKYPQDLERINYDLNLDDTVDSYTPTIRQRQLIR